MPVTDKNGNLREGEGMKLEWDAFGRLHTVRRASNDDLLARYLYDADNRLFVLGTVMHHVAGLTDEEARLAG
ncbi:MAG: hypothetical protein KF858_00590 [Candidatus Sumerlaeia bacterium]|nr:hypothetical protein [Candidatus Sumerlaeia bacterium]